MLNFNFLDNEDYLNSVHVDVDGNIMTPERRRSFPKSIITERRKAASAKRKLTASRAAATKNSEEAFFKEHSIFSEDSDEDDAM